VSAARNAGAALAQGDLLAFLDADDVWLPDKLEAQAARFAADPALGLVHCAVEEIDGEGRALRTRMDGMEGRVAEEMLLFRRAVILGGGSGAVVTRARFEEVGGFDESLGTSADWDLHHRIARRSDVGFVPRVLLRYRVHGAPARWRPGHFFRSIPAGYLESLANGDNRIRHAGLARVHDAVRSMTRDPIWSRARWAHMADLWLGRLDAGLADYVSEEYRSPPRIDVPFAEMATPPPPGSSWFESEHARTAQAGGLAVRFDGPTTASRVVAHVTGALWRLGFERNGDITGTVEVRITQPPDLLQPQNFAVPAGASPFDTILVDAIVDLESPTAACIAAIELVP
jgi:hypothetical protein